jgi:hypothetical protein
MGAKSVSAHLVIVSCLVSPAFLVHYLDSEERICFAVNEYESQGTTMKKVISLLLFVSLPAFADDLSGVWKIDGSIASNPITPTCTLKQTDKQLSGSCKIDADHVANIEGSVNEKQVTWKYDQEYQGTVYTLTYTGTLESNTSIKGTVTADPSDSTGDFTAKKQ